MSAILTPVGLLLIILTGYLFKRFGLFGQKDYRVLQTAEFNIVLPGAIVYSFATNPHDISLLLIRYSHSCLLLSRSCSSFWPPASAM